MLPSPRRFVQFRVIMESGRISDGLRVGDLTLEIASPPLARRLFGEISLLADPAPQDGFAMVPVGVPSRFAYDLLADVRDADVGIDALRITTPTRPTFVELLMGADESNLTPVVPSAVEEGSDGLTLYFPENRIAAPDLAAGDFRRRVARTVHVFQCPSPRHRERGIAPAGLASAPSFTPH